MPEEIILVSHALCPYVQRIAVALAEKGISHERVFIDLSAKPQWFLEISPLGRTPVLKVGDAAIFESAAILDYLEETQSSPLYPADPVERARHRAWIGFSSECLNEIAAFYSAGDRTTLDSKAEALHTRFQILEENAQPDPWFAGSEFGLVDAAFAPVFRYFDVFDQTREFGVFNGLPHVSKWRLALASRRSVREAAPSDYSARLTEFLRRKGTALSVCLMQGEGDGKLCA